jgi:uncharacterized protein (TIGR03435 family)
MRSISPASRRRCQATPLVVAKHRPQLKEMTTDETLPAASLPLLGGGVVVPSRRGETLQVGFFGVSTAAFAQPFVGMVAAQVVDKTGLTGRYDFVLRSGDEAPPSGPDSYLWDFEELSLEL